MAKTSTERTRALVARRKAMGMKEYRVWVTDKERAIVKPIVEDKLKELRKEDSKKE